MKTAVFCLLLGVLAFSSQEAASKPLCTGHIPVCQKSTILVCACGLKDGYTKCDWQCVKP